MKTTKKILSVLLAILLLASTMAVSFTVSAVGGTDGNITWDYNEATKTLTISGTGKMTDYTTYAATPWKDQIMDIKTVIIEPGVTSVGDYAFYPPSYSAHDISSNIESVTLPDTVETIGRYAFAASQIESVELPAGVKTVKKCAFAACSKLSTVKLSSNIELVEYTAFDGRPFNVVYDGTMEQWESFSKNTEFKFSESTIHTKTGSATLCRWCGKYHVEKNFFDKIKVFFHTLFAELFGYRYY